MEWKWCPNIFIDFDLLNWCSFYVDFKWGFFLWWIFKYQVVSFVWVFSFFSESHQLIRLFNDDWRYFWIFLGDLWDLGFYLWQTTDIYEREYRSNYAPLRYSSCRAETITDRRENITLWLKFLTQSNLICERVLGAILHRTLFRHPSIRKLTFKNTGRLHCRAVWV